MVSDTFRYATIMLAAGIGVPVLAALNAQLGRAIAAPAAAASVLFLIACIVSVITMFAMHDSAALAKIPSQPRYLLFGGVLVAFYVLSITWIAPRFGLGNAIVCVLMGQLISAAIIDQFGLMGAMVRQLTVLRAGGLALMAAGVMMVVKG